MKKLSENKKVSLIIACRNEKNMIAKCLDSILNQDYPTELMEIFVIDGESNDGTKKILTEYGKKYSRLKLRENRKIIQPHAFNMGIKMASGEYIFIMGSHNIYPKNYVSLCVKYALKYNTDNVGGRMVARTNETGLIAQAIIGSYTSVFGIGNATFRRKIDKPVYVDTVFGGCYKKEVFERIGLYNETLKRSQDMELNLRLTRSGGKILLVPDIVSYYYPKTDLLEFIKYSFKAGKGPLRAIKITGKPLKLMHYIPAMFFVGLILGLITFTPVIPEIFGTIYLSVIAIYLILSLVFSLLFAVRQKNILLVFLMPIIFLLKHIFYGAGSVYGAFRTKD